MTVRKGYALGPRSGSVRHHRPAGREQLGPQWDDIRVRPPVRSPDDEPYWGWTAPQDARWAPDPAEEAPDA